MIITVLADIRNIDVLKTLGRDEINKENNLDKNDILHYDYSKKEVLSPVIQTEVKNHIYEAKNERLRKERVGAYLVLQAAVIMIFGVVPHIEWSENGKPRYIGENIYFNLSHCGDLIAVTLSDSEPVGVDIEETIDGERAARLEARFFSELSVSERKLDVRYLFCGISEDGRCVFSNFVQSEEGSDMIFKEGQIALRSVSPSDCFSARWTLYEASLKCDGGGFTSLPCLGMILLETRADTKKITFGKKTYYVSTAASK